MGSPGSRLQIPLFKGILYLGWVGLDQGCREAWLSHLQSSEVWTNLWPAQILQLSQTGFDFNRCDRHLGMHFKSHKSADYVIIDHKPGEIIRMVASVCLSAHPRMPLWGAKVVIWVLIGCDPTCGEQNRLVGCNSQIDMRTKHLKDDLDTLHLNPK